MLRRLLLLAVVVWIGAPAFAQTPAPTVPDCWPSLDNRPRGVGFVPAGVSDRYEAWAVWQCPEVDRTVKSYAYLFDIAEIAPWLSATLGGTFDQAAARAYCVANCRSDLTASERAFLRKVRADSGVSSRRTIDPRVFTMIKLRDRLAFLPIGTVPLDTVCDSGESSNGYRVVPRDAVTFTGTARPAVVFGLCD